jgi:hypothetical protein
MRDKATHEEKRLKFSKRMETKDLMVTHYTGQFILMFFDRVQFKIGPFLDYSVQHTERLLCSPTSSVVP